MELVREDVNINLALLANGGNPFHGNIKYRNIITDAMAVRDIWDLPLDVSNPLVGTSRTKLKKLGRTMMLEQWDEHKDGSLFSLHLDNMTTAVHRKGLSYYITHDSRLVARARARFLFDRAMTNKVRSRLHDKNTCKDCTHPLCVEESRRMDEQMALLLDEDEKEDRETFHIEHNGRHVLLECPR